MDRIIFHIDVNSAYLSWQAVHMKKEGYEGEDIRNIACAIGGDEKSRHGVVLAKSDKAKASGVKTGMSLFEARKLCPKLKTLPVNFKIYRHYSNELFHLLEEYSDQIERYSIDECFLDYSASRLLFGEPFETALKIQKRIRDELGFTVNIGISSNKFLAKMAGELEKPNKVITLFPEEMEEKFFPLDIHEMFMVGRSTREKLNRLGIKTVGELNQTSLDFLIKHFKEAQGRMLYNYSHGIDESEIVTGRETKSVGNSMTLPEDITGEEEMKSIVYFLSDSVGRRLRKKDLKGNVIQVSLKNSDFYTKSRQKTLTFFTNSTKTIRENAMTLVKELYCGDRIRLIGVSVSGLDRENVSQLSFFEEANEDERNNEVEHLIDDLKTRFGDGMINKGASSSQIEGSRKISEKIDFYK